MRNNHSKIIGFTTIGSKLNLRKKRFIKRSLRSGNSRQINLMESIIGLIRLIRGRYNETLPLRCLYSMITVSFST
jgi:hypothetical protein